MALSVSGFPEPTRSPANTEPAQDDSYKLMNSPRLRSLFGKKPDSRYKDTDQDGSPSTGTPSAAATPPSTPPTTHSLPSFIEQTYMPPPEEFDLTLHMPVPIERAMIPKRPQPLPPIPIPIPIPRRATASPARLQPSLTRLDIGAISKHPHQHQQHSLPKPPTVVVEEWSKLDKGKGVALPLPPADPSSPPRPLPHPPLPPEPRQHVNAVAGPSRLPHSPPQQKHQGSGAASGSGVRARSHSRSRMHTQGIVSVGMQYQAMSVEPSEKQGATAQSASSSSASTSASASSNASASASASASGSGSGSASHAAAAAAAATSPVRPLPTLPMIAPTPISAILRTAPIAGPSKYPSAPRIKRPRTSTGIPQVGRAVFDASRPIDLNASVLASRPIHLPHKPLMQQQRPEIRIRTNTRARREHSADSYLGSSSSPPPRQTKVNLGFGGRGQRTLPSPVIGARPMPIRSATLESPRSAPPTPPPKLTILTGGRRAPRSPPSSSTTSAASAMTGKSSAVSSVTKELVSAYTSVTTPTPATTTASAKVDEEKELDDEPLLRYPPNEPDQSEQEEILEYVDPPPEEEEVLESPLEVYIDDMDTTSFSRSPSPITYARPNSRGTVVSSDEEEELGSSPTTTRQRRQPRSYRNSYRHPKPPSPPPLSRSPSPIMYARRTSLDGADELVSPVEKRRTQPRSFQFEHRGTPPGSRPASQERKSRSRQVVNMGLKKEKEKDLKGGKSKSRSPRRKFRSVPVHPMPQNLEYEPFVLDISSGKPMVSSGRDLRRDSASSASASAGSNHNNNSIVNLNLEKKSLKKRQTAVMPHRRVVSAVSINAEAPLQQAQFDPYTHGAGCGIGMLRSAEVSNSSGISSVGVPAVAAGAYRVGNSSGSSVGSGRGKEKGEGKRMTQAQSVQMQYQMQQQQYLMHEKAQAQQEGRVQQVQQVQHQHQQRQRVNSTTAYEEFFSTLRRKEQKAKDDIALVDVVRVDREDVVLGALQNRTRKDSHGWKEKEREGESLKGVLKNKRSR